MTVLPDGLTLHIRYNQRGYITMDYDSDLLPKPSGRAYPGEKAKGTSA